MTEHTYAFHLGVHPALSVAEIIAVLSHQHINISHRRTVGEFLLVNVSTPLDAALLMHTLGGSRLIAEKIHDPGNAQDVVNDYLASLPSDKKLHFSVSGSKQAERIAINAKKHLKSLGRSVRFVRIKNTASILHNGLVERASHLTIIDNVVYVTRAIQPIEEMRERDYDRPKIDDVSGMLPPKLARMMVNLTMIDSHATLLDPFCGSGTLLGEAMSLGTEHLIGSDLSKKAVSDSQENLAWLKQNLNLNPSLNIDVTDVRELSRHLAEHSVDAIATEPLMGIPRKGKETKQFLMTQAQELKALYADAFREFAKVLTPGGRVVFVIPRFAFQDDWVTIDMQKQIKDAGFDILPYADDLPMPMVYHRKGQHVGREIWRFVLPASNDKE